ncbi:heterogeneous nuclear ribonucleoprotein M-like isoform X6 [Centruroides sculpturatus]|uniref:heterogeneous nuclear ribonucleoprotein M-like isoform X5 n=1 Tax=Centruroides sculpturatus TaxID=218467 RepID=UPI000C6DF4DA|nr:heterogeneous nuclear ribonucleoprotein M-like isoform X5 [Centruroides sculpturatus]XP_023243494.1 heterogeneous nuclear ribonucleoprotein M-like isoform X6 [Centruroides sculpturatus]
METNGNQSPEIKRETRSRSRSPLNSPQERNHSSSRDSSSTRERDRSQRNRRNMGDGRREDRRSRAPSNRRVYVANIPYDCKWTDIKDIFREKVGDVSYVELFEDHDGKFRGCGIVEFKDNAAVQKAIDVLHRYEIKGRHLVVKEDFDVERDKTGRPITRSSMNMNRAGPDFNANIPPLGDNMGGGDSQFNTYGLSPHFLESLGINGPLTNRVFVANLDYKVTDKKLQDIFKMAGKVISIELKTDKEGKSKGHGIVEFDHPVEAVQAISMFNGQKLFTRSMSVRMDKYKEESDGIPTKLPAGLQGIGKGLGSGGQPINISSAGPLNTMQGGLGAMGMGMGAAPNMGAANLGMMAGAAMGMGNMGGMSGTAGGMGLGMNMQGGMGGDRSLMGGNMGTGMGNMGMGSAVGNMGLGNRSASGMMSVSGMGSGGNGMVASSMNVGMGGGGGGMGSNMNVGMGSGINSGMGMGGNMGMGGGGAGGGNSMDGFGEFDRGNDNYRSPRSSDTVVVRNLPTSYNWQTLRDRFKDIGDVRYTEVKGRGTAVVRFGTERDAQRAVDLMHGIRIDGRPIEVQLY